MLRIGDIHSRECTHSELKSDIRRMCVLLLQTSHVIKEQTDNLHKQIEKFVHHGSGRRENLGPFACFFALPGLPPKGQQKRLH